MLVSKVMLFRFESILSYISLVRIMALKSEVRIPITRVVAKPLMGPVPKKKRIKPVRKVVICASKMAE